MTLLGIFEGIAESSGFAPRATLMLGEVHHARSADVDGDGDLDLMSSDDLLNGEIRWWENVTGDGTVWEPHVIGRHQGRPFAVLDTDSDGDLDVVHWETGRELWQFINTDGKGEVWTKAAMEIEFGLLTSIGVGDVNGDGRQDFVATEDDDLAWFTREPGGWVRTTIEADQASIITRDPVDLDGDGDLDVPIEVGGRCGGLV